MSRDFLPIRLPKFQLSIVTLSCNAFVGLVPADVNPNWNKTKENSDEAGAVGGGSAEEEAMEPQCRQKLTHSFIHKSRLGRKGNAS